MNFYKRPDIDFAKALLELRAARHSCRQIGDATGIPYNTIASYCNGVQPSHKNGRSLIRYYRLVFDRDLPIAQDIVQVAQDPEPNPRM